MRLLVPLALALALPRAAHADQCQLVDDDVATRALAALADHPKVVQYCEPCGDRAPGEPAVAARVAKTRDTSGAYQITIDRREVDLAYTYVQTHLDRYENLATLAGCPASGVSPSLRVSEATASGVMIQADSTPVTVPPAPPPAPIYIVERHPSSSWAPIVLACFASTGVWALIALTIVRRRKVVAMRPRAVNLVDRAK